MSFETEPIIAPYIVGSLAAGIILHHQGEAESADLRKAFRELDELEALDGRQATAQLETRLFIAASRIAYDYVNNKQNIGTHINKLMYAPRRTPQIIKLRPLTHDTLPVPDQAWEQVAEFYATT